MEVLRFVRSRIHYKWVLLAASSIIVGMAMGSLFSISVFLKPLSADFGWPRGETAFAYTIAVFLQGISGIMTGTLADRFSARPLVLAGAVMMGGTLILLGFVQAQWQFYLLYGPFLGAIALASFLTPLLTCIGFWFDRHRGIAIGVVMAGQSTGGAVLPLIAGTLIDLHGWRTAYILLGSAAWILMLPLALLVRDPPGIAEAKAISRKAESEKKPSAVPILISPRRLTLWLGLASIMCCICMSIPLIHLVSLATDQGLASDTAARIFSVLMLTSIVGRVGIGKIADHIGGIRALLLSSGIQTTMIFWFTQMDSSPGLFLIAVLFGLGYGGVIPSYAITLREMIPIHRVGRAVGILFFFANIGMGTGGFLGGLLFDISGTYTISFSIGAMTGAINLIIVGSLLYYLHTRKAAPSAGTVTA